MKIEAVDLNLLVVFDALYAERSVTRAAARVGRSQPAVSGALARLRRLFGDPLFQRAPHGVRPTPRAEALAGPIGEALHQARLAIEGPARFDPRTAERTFLLAGSDYADLLLVPAVLAELSARAPRAALAAQRSEFLFEPPVAALQSGTVDAAVGFFPAQYAPQTGLRGATLWPERFVGVLRRGHPAARRRLDVRGLLALGHLRVAYSGGPATSMLDAVLAARGKRRRVVATVPHLAAVPDLVAATDLLGFLPERLARRAARGLALAVVALPVDLPATPFTLVWHERSEHDPAQVWLRAVVREAASA
ncbi:MAG: LysR family transcriptional regulator [Acidobacteriota bacterium]